MPRFAVKESILVDGVVVLPGTILDEKECGVDWLRRGLIVPYGTSEPALPPEDLSYLGKPLLPGMIEKIEDEEVAKGILEAVGRLPDAALARWLVSYNIPVNPAMKLQHQTLLVLGFRDPS